MFSKISRPVICWPFLGIVHLVLDLLQLRLQFVLVGFQAFNLLLQLVLQLLHKILNLPVVVLLLPEDLQLCLKSSLLILQVFHLQDTDRQHGYECITTMCLCGILNLHTARDNGDSLLTLDVDVFSFFHKVASYVQAYLWLCAYEENELQIDLFFVASGNIIGLSRQETLFMGHLHLNITKNIILEDGDGRTNKQDVFVCVRNLFILSLLIHQIWIYLLIIQLLLPS